MIPMKMAKKTQAVQTFVFRPLNKLTAITAAKTMVWRMVVNSETFINE
jgi:hypothetical protein